MTKRLLWAKSAATALGVVALATNAPATAAWFGGADGWHMARIAAQR